MRCAHGRAQTLVLLRNRDQADVVDSPAGSQQTAVHHVYSHRHGTTYLSQLPGGSQPAVSSSMHLCARAHNPMNRS